MLRATRLRAARLFELLVPIGLVMMVVVWGRARSSSAGVAAIPGVQATASWPAGDLPTLLAYELNQFADLSRNVTEVKGFGAMGDGSTDDTAAVQSAINAANGGTLHFPAGVFVIDSVTVSGASRVRLLGDGQGVT